MVDSYQGINQCVPFDPISNWESVKSAVSPRGEVVTAAKLLDSTHHGYSFFLNSATEFKVTLPSLKDCPAGWWCEFFVQAAPVGANYQISENATDDTNKLVTLVNELETDTTNDGPSSSGHTFINFIASTALQGDWVRCTSNGVNFYCIGQVGADGAITLT